MSDAGEYARIIDATIDAMRDRALAHIADEAGFALRVQGVLIASCLSRVADAMVRFAEAAGPLEHRESEEVDA